MSVQERQQQFESAVRASALLTGSNPRVQGNFGFSNRARILEGGLFAATSNLATYARNLATGAGNPNDQLVLLCVLDFPPNDEVYFAIGVRSDMPAFNAGLKRLYEQDVALNEERASRGEGAGKICNNVKIYAANDGRIYFHNHDFIGSLLEAKTSGDLDPACSAAIDWIAFAIFPPTISARRGLLSREFVGYLGGLVGRDKVHELKVWSNDATVSAGMRRNPADVALSEIEAAIISAGGHYPHGEIRRLHAGLNFHSKKHFVILSGLSGTGKTQLAIKYARAVHGITRPEDEDPFLFVCPVRPEWTDPTGLTGYYDVLSNRYVVPRFLEAVLVATSHTDAPVFVILDELNLARIEYYFSDILSVIETEGKLVLHSSGVPIEGSTGTPILPALPFPRNLYIVGTINIDETTHAISDKVLDRAVHIDMSQVDLEGFLQQLVNREPNLAATVQSGAPTLTKLHTTLSEYEKGFGYRVAEEAVRYVAFVTPLGSTIQEALDEVLVQKVFTKLRGAERERPMLEAALVAAAGMSRSEKLLKRLLSELDQFGSFQAQR